MRKIFDLMNPLQEKRLESLVKAIVGEFKPLKLVCFASSLITDATLSCFSEQKLIESCDYDILIITAESGRSEEEVQEFTSKIYKHGIITTLTINRNDMKEATEAKNLYITTILQKGAVLYVADGFEKSID